MLGCQKNKNKPNKYVFMTFYSFLTLSQFFLMAADATVAVPLIVFFHVCNQHYNIIVLN